MRNFSAREASPRDLDRSKLAEIADDLRGPEMASLHLTPQPLN